MTNTELLPCPFCGNKPVNNPEPLYFTVGCDSDECTMNPSVSLSTKLQGYREQVIRCWNTRASLQPATPTAPEKGWLQPALDKAAERAAEMPDWMTRTGGDAVAGEPFYGAQCPTYPDCSGGCGLGCTHEIEQARVQAATASNQKTRCEECNLLERCSDPLCPNSAAKSSPDPVAYRVKFKGDPGWTLYYSDPRTTTGKDIGLECVEPLFTNAAQCAWRPIETAPRDGTRILATGGGLDNIIEIVDYNVTVGAWNAPNDTLDDRDDEAEGYNRPALWQPLPALSISSTQSEPGK